MTAEEKLKLCQGCRNDYYNHHAKDGCWKFKASLIIARTQIGIWQEPPYEWKPQRTLDCHSPPGRAWIDNDDPRIERDKA